MKKKKFKDLLSVESKKLYFIFNNISHKQINEVAMESLLGPTLANAFLAHHEQNCLDCCPFEYIPLYYGRYFDEIFIIFKSSDHLKQFQSYLNSCHVNMRNWTVFTVETEQNNKISFLDVKVIRE